MSRIQTKVMASVLLIFAARQLVTPVALKAYALLAGFLFVASLVSVGDVVSNFFAVGLSGAFGFVFAALTNAQTMVQITTLLVALFAVLLVRDIVRPTRIRVSV